jgi:four helix bundle protein
MGALRHAFSFKDLVVYQKAFAVAQRVFELTKRFPREERYSLTDQFRRASRSIGGQIAEAWGKRRYERHFVSKLTDADAEQLETQHWVATSRACDYLTEQEAGELDTDLLEVGKMLKGMIGKAPSFCGTPADRISEEFAEYVTDDAATDN